MQSPESPQSTEKIPEKPPSDDPEGSLEPESEPEKQDADIITEGEVTLLSTFILKNKYFS